jgi:hypothetical protein
MEHRTLLAYNNPLKNPPAEIIYLPENLTPGNNSPLKNLSHPKGFLHFVKRKFTTL